MSSAHDLIARWPTLGLVRRRERLQHGCRQFPGRLGSALSTYDAAARRALAGLWRRDAATWSAESNVQATIAQRLGWLDSPGLMADNLTRLTTCADDVRRAGFTDAVLLGMGGSSLAPEVLRGIVGVAPGGLRLHMLDSTDPASVLAVKTDPRTTLYIFASKSGTTIEPNALAAYYRHELEHAGVSPWATHFIAITDEGTELAAQARRRQFREVFINPSDIGGRYSALSYFGLVPAALMGQDVAALIGYGLATLMDSAPDEETGTQPLPDAVALGIALAAGAHQRSDKLTLLVPAALEPFGLWIEQLVAESTGKQGVGVIPITGETPGPVEVYGDDRVYVRMQLGQAETKRELLDSLVEALQARHAPVFDITMPEPTALGAEFVRWEIATAVAGALLRINPFDEPNVSQAKEATRVLLTRFKQDGQLTWPRAERTDDDIRVAVTEAGRRSLGDRDPRAILTLLQPGDYLALLAYLGPDPTSAAALHSFRMAVRDRTRHATMFGYGPRYLHSTGQLHKGGPNTGVFVLVSSLPHVDFPIPGEAFSFGTLELAQAIGDFQSLDATGRRAVHIHLPDPTASLLPRALTPLLSWLDEARNGGNP
jgi:glucose-6-phosphate isomerase